MPKHKDKSFELMASIGEAKQPPKADQEKSITPKPEAIKTAKKVSNIPYSPPSLAMKKQLKRLALEEETTMTALISEGLNHVFKARGLKTIEQLLDDT